MCPAALSTPLTKHSTTADVVRVRSGPGGSGVTSPGISLETSLSDTISTQNSFSFGRRDVDRRVSQIRFPGRKQDGGWAKWGIYKTGSGIFNEEVVVQRAAVCLCTLQFYLLPATRSSKLPQLRGAKACCVVSWPSIAHPPSLKGLNFSAPPLKSIF